MKEVKTVVFLSNTFNHHQKPFSDAMFSRLGNGYRFIETRPMCEEQIKLGWKMEQYPQYVVSCEEFRSAPEKCANVIREADVVITGAAPDELIRQRIALNRLVFRYSERPLKNGLELWKYPYRFLKWRRRNPHGKKIYMLCASAYTASDYSKFALFRGRCYQWGYFPEAKVYDDIAGLIRAKPGNQLIWAGRFIEFKHPEIAVETAMRLKRAGYQFRLRMIGNGKQLEAVTDMVRRMGLEDVVELMGAMPPEEVRSYMEQADIHIFTSDRGEGWGAVLNESMNSACVPVANREIGSAPYLIDDGENGYLYSTNEELYERVRALLDNRQKREKMAKAAYDTIADEWNADVAAERLLRLSAQLLNGEDRPVVCPEGVCSKA